MVSSAVGDEEEGGVEAETVMACMPAVAVSRGSTGSQRAWVGCMVWGYCIVLVCGS